MDRFDGADSRGRLTALCQECFREPKKLPKISASDLKPGDAVVISGSAGDDKSHLTAINIIAGVEPLFASAPSKAGRSAALGMWNLDVGTPGEDSSGAGGDSSNK